MRTIGLTSVWLAMLSGCLSLQFGGTNSTQDPVAQNRVAYLESRVQKLEDRLGIESDDSLNPVQAIIDGQLSVLGAKLPAKVEDDE